MIGLSPQKLYYLFCLITDVWHFHFNANIKTRISPDSLSPIFFIMLLFCYRPAPDTHHFKVLSDLQRRLVLNENGKLL